MDGKLAESGAHLADDKNVGEPGGKAVPSAVFNMHHIKRARMLLSIGDHTNTPQVSTSGHHAHVAYLHTGNKGKSHGKLREKQKHRLAEDHLRTNLSQT